MQFTEEREGKVLLQQLLTFFLFAAALESAAGLLSLDVFGFGDALTQKFMVLRGEEITTPLTVEQVRRGREGGREEREGEREMEGRRGREGGRWKGGEGGREGGGRWKGGEGGREMERRERGRQGEAIEEGVIT